MEVSDATLNRLLELFRGFPLLPIRTETELERAQAVVDELLGRERDEAEELYLDVLGTLIHAYEEVHVAIPELSGLELLHALIIERGLSQRDLVRAGIFATDSVASEVLAGKRSLNADQVRALTGYFHLPADLFLRQPQAAA